MERNKVVKLGVMGVAMGGAFMLLQATNRPQTIIQEVAAPVVEEVQQEFVLVATDTFTRGQRLDAELLDWQQWPSEAVTDSFIVRESRPQAIEELSGSVVRSDIFPGEPLNEAKLVRAGDSGLMAALLAPGMRAVTTRVTLDTAAGGFIMPGDRVDILSTRQLPRQVEPGNANRNTVTQYATSTVFSDVKVLAMNQSYSTGPDSPAALDNVSFATFELSPSDSERLEEAAQMGTLSLTLRGLQPNATPRSAARIERPVERTNSTLLVYRNGQQTQTAIRGQ